MFKFLILTTVIGFVASEEKDWFKGRWLQVAEYPGSTAPVCEWLEFSPALTSECVALNKTIHFVALFLLNQNDVKAFPAMMFEDVDGRYGLKETLEQKCKRYNGVEENLVVFRKINENYMVVYGRNAPRVDSKGPAPYQALLLVKVVPMLSELQRVMSEINDLSNRTYTINCERNYFVKEVK